MTRACYVARPERLCYVHFYGTSMVQNFSR
uniref:Uncharacterized protein n=1 Tax=Arundo donax TaxID=35708 RepID=A0A0A8ZS74_ARUDO